VIRPAGLPRQGPSPTGDADAAWAAESRFEADLGESRSARARALAALDPRPLMSTTGDEAAYDSVPVSVDGGVQLRADLSR